MNQWLKQDPEGKPKRMLRTLETRPISAIHSLRSDSLCRAFLSERYRPMDNYSLAEHVLPLFKENEWEDVGEWMWENRKVYNGLAVLPYSEHTHVQLPFQECSKEEYDALLSTLKDIDLTKIIEMEDNTDLAGELACQAGNCEVK